MTGPNSLNESILKNRLPDLVKVHYFDQLESTNDFGKELAADTNQVPALIYAHTQTKGRGRGGKSWISNSGSMTFSFLIDEFPGVGVARVALSWGMAVAQALNELCGLNNMFKVKWPNDVMALDRKVCGVLIESIASPVVSSSNSLPHRFVVGIGINVDQKKELLLEGLDSQASRAISVFEATGKQVAYLDILASIWKRYGSVKQLTPDVWRRQFESIDYLKSKSLTVQSGNNAVRGKYIGLGNDLALKVLSEGTVHEIHSGTLSQISDVESEDCGGKQMSSG